MQEGWHFACGRLYARRLWKGRSILTENGPICCGRSVCTNKYPGTQEKCWLSWCGVDLWRAPAGRHHSSWPSAARRPPRDRRLATCGFETAVR